MKIQCDVCEKEEASVFCCADEAALCEACDQRVHLANKLATKHLRFPLSRPSLKDSPLCDICQERRGFLFCKEDRAILCRECDIPVHKANEHTRRHSRFLLTGVRISAAADACQPSSSSKGSMSDPAETEAAEVKSSTLCEFYKWAADANEKAFSTPSTSASSKFEDHGTGEEGITSITTSNISEYLMETLPGWHLEDFLDPTSHHLGFCKVCRTP